MGFSHAKPATAAAKGGTIRFSKDNVAVKEDVVSVNAKRNVVKAIEKRIKADKKAGLKEAVILDKKELTKAKADLEKSRSYLTADKKDFKRDYVLAINNCKKAVKEDKAELRKSKKKLQLDMWKKHNAALVPDAAKVAEGRKKLKWDETALSNEKRNMKTDMATLNKEVKKSEVEPAAVKSVETAYANVKSDVKGWFKKSKKS
ncbi:MAG TPA: hypothetical protein VNY73_07070 [Bacteroidia bacterium]|nr:hypothetical protein [Bacteroidia bacterium]